MTAHYNGWVNAWFCIVEDENSRVLQKIYGSTKLEAEANAKLFLAARDLLEACKAVMNSPRTESLKFDVLNKLYESIKKATE